MEQAAQIFINIAHTALLYNLVAISFYVIYSTTKFLNISHAAIITVAPYFYLILLPFTNNIYITFLFSVALSCLLSLTILTIGLLPLLKRNALNWVILIASLGVYIILQNIISLLWGDKIHSIRISDFEPSYEIGGAYITRIQIVSISIGLISTILIWLFYKLSKTGMQMKAIASNLSLASIFGINLKRIFIISFIIGSFLAASAGILIGFDIDIVPTMGFNILIYGVVAMMIGGTGNIWNILWGSLILASSQHLGAYFIDSKWMDAIAYVLLISFLIWRPLGFSGKRLKKIEI